MTHDITQWLDEIKDLKQKLAEAYKERDSAYASATNWRKLYETEAQQRRLDTANAQVLVDELKAELQRLQTKPTIEPDAPAQAVLQRELAGLKTPEQLRQKLVGLVMERDRLASALETEQASHAQTRQILTTALGDTVELLTQERASQHSQPME